MPNVAALIDEIRVSFPSAKIVWAVDTETGVEVGKKPVEDGFVIPEHYGRSSTVQPAAAKKGKR